MLEFRRQEEHALLWGAGVRQLRKNMQQTTAPFLRHQHKQETTNASLI